MSWKTRYFDGDSLLVLNDRLAGRYQPAIANFGSNLSSQYRGEIDEMLAEVASMEERELRHVAGLMREWQ